MAARVLVLRFKSDGKGLNTCEEQILETARLLRHSCLELMLIVSVFNREPALFQGLPHARAHILERVEWLDEIVHCAEIETTHRDIYIRHPGCEHHGYIRIASTHLAQKLNAIHVWHAQIAEHNRDG